jgi:hypothetical protein
MPPTPTCGPAVAEIAGRAPRGSGYHPPMIGRRISSILRSTAAVAAFLAVTGGIHGGGLRVATAGPDAAGAPPSVVLLAAGKKPRAPLRYSLPSSFRKKMGMTITIGMDMLVAGQNVNMHLPPMRIEMALSVIGKVGPREARCKFEVTGADLRPGGDKIFDSTRPQLLASLKKMVGTSGTLVMDDRGVVRDVKLSLPPDIEPQARQAMESTSQAMSQFSSPLPEEPVGVGARWQVNQSIDANGLKLKQKAVFELVSFKGKKGVVKATISQTADPQVANLPGLPPGVKADLLSHSGTGTGSGDLDLTQLVPAAFKVGVKTDTSMKITGGGQQQDMKMKVDTSVDINRL